MSKHQACLTIVQCVCVCVYVGFTCCAIGECYKREGERALRFSSLAILTQKYCRLKPGILVWEAPTSWRYVRNVSMSSRLLIPSSRVDMTVFACSANSMLVDCCSFVFRSRNFVNMFNNSAFSSNNLEAKAQRAASLEECC